MVFSFFAISSAFITIRKDVLKVLVSLASSVNISFFSIRVILYTF